MDIPGEKLAIKIWETLTEKGVGGLLTPWQIKREGRAHADVRRHEKLLLVQAEKDAQDILAGRKAVDADGRLVELKQPEARALPAPKAPAEAPRALVDQRDPSSKLLTNAAEKFSAREVQRFVNLQRIAMSAEEQAQHIGDEGVSEEAVDADWLNRWRENAQDVSTEHMQKVWARILAEEVKTPGTYSMGTLEFLRTLSKTDALKISAIGPYVIFNRQFVFRDQPFLDRKGILFSHLLELQEMGVLSGVEAIGLTWSLNSAVADKYQNILVSHGKGLYIQRDAKEPALQFTVYRVTKLGREILALGDYNSDDEYMKHLGAFIKGKGFKVNYGDWTRIDAGTGYLANPVEL